MSIGNEQEYHLSGLSVSQWIAHAKTLATQVKAVYSGKVSYDTSGDFEGQWLSAGSLGSLDAIGLNLYCGAGCNQNDLQKAITQWGKTHVEVTETACDLNQCVSDSSMAAEVKTDALKLVAMGVPVYYFALRSGGDGTESYWAIINKPLTLTALGL